MARKRIKTIKCSKCGYNFNHGENFCPSCGQENHAPNQPFKHLFLEFFESLFHFDTKVFLSLKYLLFYPGRMTLEFLENKRARFVPPVRLYIFISVIFFVFINRFTNRITENITTNENSGLVVFKDGQYVDTSDSDVVKLDSSFKRKLDTIKDSDPKQSPKANENMQDSGDVNFGLSQGFQLTKNELEELIKRPLKDINFDSILAIKKVPNNFIYRQFLVQYLKAKKDSKTFGINLVHTFVKNTTMAMFFLMPFFGMIIFLLYFRRGKNYYEYLIYSIHFHTAVFAYLIIVFVFDIFLDMDWIYTYLFWGFLLYQFFALNLLHKQKILTTVFKAFISILVYSVVVLVGLLVSILIGAFIV